MAYSISGQKRKAKEAAHEDSDDDSCILVGSTPSHHLQTSIRTAPGPNRQPLAQANAPQTHNKRRRIVECVLLPKGNPASHRLLTPSPQHASYHTADLAGSRSKKEQVRQDRVGSGQRFDGESTPKIASKRKTVALPEASGPKQSSILGFFKDTPKPAPAKVSPRVCRSADSTTSNLTNSVASIKADPRSTTSRPRRSATRTSLGQDILMVDTSEDELAQSGSTNLKRSKSNAKSEPDESDFEEDMAVSSVQESEEEGSKTKFDDGSSVLPSEHLSEDALSEPEGKSKKSKMKKLAPAGKKLARTKPAAKPSTSKTGTKAMKNLSTRGASSLKGLAMGLPPLSNISDIFGDMTKKALGLGFNDAVEHLGSRPLRVATMCSGTESPLLALEMIRDALKDLSPGTINLQHLFSAEIVPYKQAYIERNFNPPIIFRDITELTEAVNDDVPMATTAYGARVAVPTHPDIVIAGTSCVDFSRLNQHKKGLEGGGESDKTWHAVLAFCKAFRPPIVIIENVRNASWDLMLEHYQDAGYESAGVLVDTKDFYLPHTRQRGYMVCFDKAKLEHSSLSGAGAKWQALMGEFRRYASSPVSSFLLPSDQVTARQQTRDDDTTREVDWSACEITQLQYRQDEKLGNARPFTHWLESGTILPPENTASSPWWRKQVERVKDTYDCSILRKATRARGMYDARFKTRIWDLSQNVYRFTDASSFGITGCITPSGQFFVSDAARALLPEENLALQGLPLDRISFTTESPAEIQDMAGNAMTATVVGPAILAALITGHRLLHDLSDDMSLQSSVLPDSEPRQSRLVFHNMQTVTSNTLATEVDVTALIAGARRAMRRCYCEGNANVAEKPIQQCVDCGHTTCTACGGNPAHNYRQNQALTNDRLSPLSFEAELRSQLPLRLEFRGSLDVKSLKAQSDNKRAAQLSEYMGYLQAATSEVYNFVGVRRTHCWTVSYEAAHTRLNLVIDDNHAEWRLFGLPKPDSARNAWSRTMLEQPIAKSSVTNSLFDTEWFWRVPSKHGAGLKITGRGQAASWWCRNQMPLFEQHAVPDRLSIHVSDDQGTDLRAKINGSYQYRPLCGTACDSLYVREKAGSDDKAMYLFLDPARTGEPESDSFVFSADKSLLEYDETRSIVARLDPAWRPWEHGSKSTTVRTLEVGIWVQDQHQCLLQAHETALELVLPVESSACASSTRCREPLALVDCSLPSHATSFSNSGSYQGSVPIDSKSLLEHMWVFEAIRRHLSSEWQSLDTAGLEAGCTDCAPTKPALRWMVEDDSVKPYEDVAAAAVYERSMKSRPAPLIIELDQSSQDMTTIKFGVDVVSLAHRALARLVTCSSDVELQWRLDTSSSKESSISFPDFKLRPTQGIEPYEGDLGMSVSLFPKQQLSLAWMRLQEAGEGTEFIIEEAEEATLPSLGWRAEVRASAPIHVRGGICADHPGFGKTITSLALIQAQMLEKDAAHIREDLMSRQSGASAGLIASSATVIICPSTLTAQWASEIQDKLGSMRGVCTVNSVAHLSKYSLADFEDAKIILVNRAIFGLESYAERLAAFAATPGPATNSGRSFAQWLEFARRQIPEHLQILQQSGIAALRSHVKAKYQALIRNEDFRAAVPSRRLRGKDYVAGGKKSQALSTKAASSSIDVGSIDAPLLEMFYFNRLIVDEFHLYDAKEYAAVTALYAGKRWGLSATPALDDFYDIAKMAGLIGVPLRIGSDAKGIMKRLNVTRLRKDMTDFERFDAMRQTLSSSMHTRIHEIDQLFLDTFVRRNIMDFAEMKYEDKLTPVTLDLDHRAMYTELLQHLNSLDMRIKKNTKSKTTDREERLHAAVATSNIAEEALSKSGAFFQRDVDAFADSGAGLCSAISIREEEAKKLLRELRGAIVKARKAEPASLKSWKEARVDNKTLGDGATISEVKQLFGATPCAGSTKETEPKSKISSRKRDDDDDDEEDESKGSKAAGKNAFTSAVNGLCNRLVASRRSLRFLQNVRRLQEQARGSAAFARCDSAECQGKLQSTDNVAVSAYCGHSICKACHQHLQEQYGKLCPATGCSTAMHPFHLLWKTKMGDLHKTTHSAYGAKLDAATDILESIQAKGDQAILFVQYEEQLEEAERALADRQIPAVVVKRGSGAGAQIAAFRTNDEHTVIVLNSSDETAAGSNLQNANHVIFLSPLLEDSQYNYEATMAQAIGRVRRHGQKKQIYVYRIVALDTIDVDILEHRERRIDALTEHNAPAITPPPMARSLGMHDEPKTERTQLVRENGLFSLRPQSWLVRCGADQDAEEVEKVKGRSRVLGWEDFSSLVKFSRAYTEDDD